MKRCDSLSAPNASLKAMQVFTYISLPDSEECSTTCWILRLPKSHNIFRLFMPKPKGTLWSLDHQICLACVVNFHDPIWLVKQYQKSDAERALVSAGYLSQTFRYEDNGDANTDWQLRKINQNHPQPLWLQARVNLIWNSRVPSWSICKIVQPSYTEIPFCERELGWVLSKRHQIKLCTFFPAWSWSIM